MGQGFLQCRQKWAQKHLLPFLRHRVSPGRSRGQSLMPGGVAGTRTDATKAHL